MICFRTHSFDNYQEAEEVNAEPWGGMQNSKGSKLYAAALRTKEGLTCQV